MDINTSTYNKRSDVYLIRRVQVKGQEIRDLSGRLEKEAFWRKVNMDSIHDMTLADVKVGCSQQLPFSTFNGMRHSQLFYLAIWQVSIFFYGRRWILC